MKIKTLFRVRRMRRKINHAIFNHDRAKEALTQTTKANDGLPKSPNKNKFASLTAKVLDAEKYIARLEGVEQKLSHTLAKIFIHKFANADDYFNELRTLILRYCDLKTFRQIAQVLRYSVASVYRFHHSGLLFLGFTETDIHTIEAIKF